MRLGKYRISLRNNDLILLLIIFGWSGMYYFEASGMRQKSLMLALIQPVFFVMLILLAFYLYSTVKIEKISYEQERGEPFLKKLAAMDKRLPTFFGLFFLYLAAFNIVGFNIATVLYIGATMAYLGLRNIIYLILIPIITTAFIYIVFVKIFYIALPKWII